MSHTHRYTHMHTCIHTQAYKHTCMQIHIHRGMHMHTGTQVHTYIDTQHTHVHTHTPEGAWRKMHRIDAFCFLSLFLTSSVHSWVTQALCWVWVKTPLWWRVHAERENSELCSLNYLRLGEQVLIFKMTEPGLVLQSSFPPLFPSILLPCSLQEPQSTTRDLRHHAATTRS